MPTADCISMPITTDKVCVSYFTSNLENAINDLNWQHVHSCPYENVQYNSNSKNECCIETVIKITFFFSIEKGVKKIALEELFDQENQSYNYLLTDAGS